MELDKNMDNTQNRADLLRKCAQDIVNNADELIADVPYYQDVDVVIHISNADVPIVKVMQRYIPEEIVLWYKENNL